MGKNKKSTSHSHQTELEGRPSEGSLPSRKQQKWAKPHPAIMGEIGALKRHINDMAQTIEWLQDDIERVDVEHTGTRAFSEEEIVERTDPAFAKLVERNISARIAAEQGLAGRMKRLEQAVEQVVQDSYAGKQDKEKEPKTASTGFTNIQINKSTLANLVSRIDSLQASHKKDLRALEKRMTDMAAAQEKQAKQWKAEVEGLKKEVEMLQGKVAKKGKSKVAQLILRERERDVTDIVEEGIPEESPAVGQTIEPQQPTGNDRTITPTQTSSDSMPSLTSPDGISSAVTPDMPVVVSNGRGGGENTRSDRGVTAEIAKPRLNACATIMRMRDLVRAARQNAALGEVDHATYETVSAAQPAEGFALAPLHPAEDTIIDAAAAEQATASAETAAQQVDRGDDTIAADPRPDPSAANAPPTARATNNVNRATLTDEQQAYIDSVAWTLGAPIIARADCLDQTMLDFEQRVRDMLAGAILEQQWADVPSSSFAM